MWRVLYNGSFRNLWLANLLSLLGSHISRIGIILHLVQSTNKMMNLAFLVMLETLPGALIAPFSGATVDRLNKRLVMVMSDVLRLAGMAVIIFYPTVLVIYLMTALHSMATVFFEPARAASVPLIVEREELIPANGLDQGVSNLMMVAGPIIGAELYLRTGLAITLTVDVCSFLLSALLLIGVSIRRPQETPGEPHGSTFEEIRKGWVYLSHHQLARHLISLFFVSLLCVGLWVPLVPFFIRDFLSGSERILGIQMGVVGLGGIVGAFIAPRLVRRTGRGAALFGALLGEGLLMTLYSFIPHVATSILICFVWGINVSIILVPYYSIVQDVVHENFLGRVFSIAKQSESIAILLAVVMAVSLQRIMSADQIFFVVGVLYCALIAASAATVGGRQLIKIR